MISKYSCTITRNRKVHFPTGQVMTAQRAARALRAMLGETDREHFCVLYLDINNVIIGCEKVSTGTRDACPVDIPLVFKGAILAGASGIVVGHNHPSGDPEPSAQDYKVTKILKKAGMTLDIPVCDHIILGEGTSYASC